MLYFGVRMFAGMLWASSITLLVAGSYAQVTDTRLMFFSWGVVLGLAGTGLASCLFYEHILRKESDRNARLTADAVGEALRSVLTEDHGASRVSRLR